ncbi:MAG: FHA domain-containing protein [Myxococcales bacterium]
MTATDSEVLARMRLVQGRSAAQTREFTRSRGQTQLLTVGTDTECDWCVNEAGVAPVHFSLHWDGANLRIADTHGAGRVRVDGSLLGPEWRRLSGRMRIDFGNATIAVDAQGPTGDEPDAWANQGRQTYPETPVDTGARPYGQVSSPSNRPGSRTAVYASVSPSGYSDQRTAPGYPSVQVAGVRVAGAESARQSERPAVTQRFDESVVAEIQLSSISSPSTGLAVRGPEPAARNPIVADSPFVEQARRIPTGVVVLSPVAGSAEPPNISDRPSLPVRQARTLPPWRTVGLSLLGVVGGYLTWLWLLYHL